MQVTWGNGATIGGSSGSPLIDVATQKVVGVLTGGYTNCHDRTQSDYYGRLSAVSAPACLCMHTSHLLAQPQQSLWDSGDVAAILLPDWHNICASGVMQRKRDLL